MALFPSKPVPLSHSSLSCTGCCEKKKPPKQNNVEFFSPGSEWLTRLRLLVVGIGALSAIYLACLLVLACRRSWGLAATT